jgi:hypothetical protein
MVKIDRIANKLAVAGLTGVVQSVGTFANHPSPETPVDAATRCAGGQHATIEAAQSLSNDSNRLKLEIGKFIHSTRAA